ncbi:MAG: polyphosphate kinase 1 [Acidobacteria bacterium]|nr:MAG: polyphosphate kinase 1 [Acidobacteriota bacterium]REK02102.1 MAG: polyphosphate kinase 1 [Acidobacteriota bacterium]REK15060.1 MAG: polyphosphate kinase 1 [Acidobacteriota bacterium]REK46150.1 MAG: polyphosphate kinase 1 [Acidobacteriota bacterium]
MTQEVREFVPSTEYSEGSDSPELLDVHDPQYLTNRELSWLKFNHRVLEQALDESVPLLERLKFLSIFSTNLDEFFMIRFSGLKEQIAEGILKKSPDGMTPDEQVVEIRKLVRPMLRQQMECLNNEIIPLLHDEGIRIESYTDQEGDVRRRLDEYFLNEVFPVLTPQSVDESHPFPYISSLSVNIGLMVDPDPGLDYGKIAHLYDHSRFVRIKLPPNIPRLVPVGEGDSAFVHLSQIVSANTTHLFPNLLPAEPYLFRVTRDADIEIREDEAGDLLRTMERELLHRRRFSFPVRLEIISSMPSEMQDLIKGSIGLTDDDVYQVDGFLNIPDLMPLYKLDRPDLKDRPIVYSIPKALKQPEKDIFSILQESDVLVHHPYTSYKTIVDFLNSAAEDEDVRAIKICLYRTGKDSPIVRSLMRASQNGKQVAALVELKARFDEENNIEWARALENEGVHVIYGMLGLKTHSKVALVIRREGDELRRYVHIATGNYNPVTAKIYTDLGLLTSDEEIGRDASDLFNFLTGYSYQKTYRQLMIAPVALRERMLKLIKRETRNRQDGKPARIIAKLNSLTDDKIVRALYRASQAGVEIDLIVRGICVLRPGIKGLSENIRVVSIVGRFLEHHRIFYFANGGDEEIYIGSADWMHRNLDRRVEAVVPIKDPELGRYLKDEVLGAYLRDTANARILGEDGEYSRLRGEDGERPFDSQIYFEGHDV